MLPLHQQTPFTQQRTRHARANHSLLVKLTASQHRRTTRLASSGTNTAASVQAVSGTGFQWSSHVSRRINLDLAVEEAVSGALNGREESWQPELAVVFLSSAYVADYQSLVALLRQKIPSLQRVFGSTGYGVIGSTSEGPEEIEHAPSLSVTLASLPGVHVSIQHVTSQQLPDGDAPPQQWADLLGVQLHSDQATNFMLLADPEFSRLQELTAGLDFAFPSANKIGGLVSAGKLSSSRAMFAWSQHSDQQQQQQQDQQPQQQQQPQPALYRTGAVVMSLQGPVEMELLIAQGCRPLSDRLYSIDQVAPHSSVVLALRDAAGRQLSPVEALQQELRQAASNRTELMQLLGNMALGVMPEVLRSADGPQPEPHDFLIRGIALDKAGFMIVGDAVRVGQRVRFMVRDRVGAQQDLTNHCMAYKRRELAAALGGGSSSKGQAFGMLMFSCNGRGMNLYDEPSYDSRTLASYIPVPCGGFMCNGEIGTLGGTTHLHGFTCATAVLRAASPRSTNTDNTSVANSSGRTDQDSCNPGS